MKLIILSFLTFLLSTGSNAGVIDAKSITREGSSFTVSCNDGHTAQVAVENILNDSICGGPAAFGPKFLLTHVTPYYSSCPSWGMDEALRKVKIKCVFDQDWKGFDIIDQNCEAEFDPNPFSTDCRENCEIRARCVN